MIVRLLDKLLDFFASLKLAICLILSLAFYLAAATFYEARYGTRAVQDCIYGSRPFILIMAMLSINVMAAVLVRYPWKRKQTGFIITHAGIEILLLGCLISFRMSIDGRLSMEPGQKSEVINLNDEELGVQMADEGGHEYRHAFPLQLWHEAGYPGLAKFVAGAVGLVDLPEQARWPQGHTVVWPLGPGAKMTILDWIPAAVQQTLVQPSPDGFPAAIVHLGGHLPNGMAMDQTIPLIADGQGGGMVRPFGGQIEFNLWKARSPDEVTEFTNPPKPTDLPEMGRVAIHLNGKRYALDVTKDTLNKDQPLGDSGFKAAVEDYILHPPSPQLPEGHGAEAIAQQPVDPQIDLRLTGPSGVRRYLLAAWHPQFMALLDDANATQHGASRPDDPLVYYWHPQAFFTTTDGTRGRLQLLQTPDGKLVGKLFRLARADLAPPAPFEVAVGREMPDFWNTISLTISQHVPSGILVNDFRPAVVEPNQMDEHPRAIKVAVDIDGTHQETWLERGDQPLELTTSRGPVQIDYSFREYRLGFGIGLEHAEQTNDPGSAQAASYTSKVSLMGSDKNDGSHTITMNEPVTANGLTFYQAGFANEEGTIISTLSVRSDPGQILKDIGCLGIVSGIFTMFYMKAYFQKSPPAPAKAAVKIEKSKRRQAFPA